MAAKKSAKSDESAKPAKKAAAKKSTAAKKAPAAKKSAPAKPSLDEIARVAYLNYRRRIEEGLPGNSQSDWLQAEESFNK